MTQYQEFFTKATGTESCYPYQRRLAEAARLPDTLNVPTGAGKTAAIIVGWLWRRRCAPAAIQGATPRRLVYCLPMRVLVEQTFDCAKRWLDRLGLASENSDGVSVSMLMGGESDQQWDILPEKDHIVIGTQDMLLSRALNRGYGMARSRWPIDFALLNNDALWILDEVQLMGSGLPTTAQLEAFRRSFGVCGTCQSIWMSATMNADWLATVDFGKHCNDVAPMSMDGHDREQLQQKLTASKSLKLLSENDPLMLAKTIYQKHLDLATESSRTLIVMNTVERAAKLFEALTAQVSKEAVEILLIHSRFRLNDRRRCMEQLLTKPSKAGTIVVATQVVEAGVDVSAQLLFTELAPWSSLVQRFGRCNRYGEFTHAEVHWLDLDENRSAAPYAPSALAAARQQLTGLESVNPAALEGIRCDLEEEVPVVLRRKDVIELFDTSTDLMGRDTDVSRFIRDTDDHDVQVFWRDDSLTGWDSAPQKDELCSVPVTQFENFIRKHRNDVYRWDFLEGRWTPAGGIGSIIAGGQYLIASKAGGYDQNTGWSPSSKTRVEPLKIGNKALDASARDLHSHGYWQSIAQHSNEVVDELAQIVQRLGVLDKNLTDALVCAARWHDRGKAHSVFQSALPCDDAHAKGSWAKSDGQASPYERPHFRHELASALAVLDASEEHVPGNLRDLVAYLVAAHHGKIRLTIRSMPNEKQPGESMRYARGVWEGDELPPADLGTDVVAPLYVCNLGLMELGCADDGTPSWVDRVLRLRERFGPFRLAFLEALLRAADMRASARHAQAGKEG